MNFFVFLKKTADFCMTTISFGAFVFGSIGVLLSVVDLVDARKIIKVCLMLKLVFLVLFSDIDFFVFQKTVAYFMTTIFLSVFSFRINWRLLPFGFMDVWKVLKVCLIFPILPICCISRFFCISKKMVDFLNEFLWHFCFSIVSS